MSFYPLKKEIFCWVLSYIGIEANLATKAALNLSCANLVIPYTDLKFHIDRYIMSSWHDEWNNTGANKFHSLKPVSGDWQSFYR